MMTPYDIAIATAKHFGLSHTLIHKTDSIHFTQPAKRPPKTGFVIDKARKELGFSPHRFEEGLAIMANQMKD
jgi:dTDP-4-dehydrorhamnose reductase